MSLQKRLLLGATAFASLFGSNALAQTAPDVKAAVSDEIIVTAQRRAENLQDVPLSVTAVSAATLEERSGRVETLKANLEEQPGHPATIEIELIRSRFSGSSSDVFGGYAMAQVSLLDARTAGDLDLFLRYDFVSLGQDSIAARAQQRSIRAGFNYNLPYTAKLASVHLEYAHNSVVGPALIISQARPGDEVRIGLRVSLQRYLRH